MRKPLLYLYIMIAAMLGLAVTSHCQEVKPSALPWGPNLCPNNSFEDVDADTHPVGWNFVHRGQEGIFKYSATDEGCAGKKCLALSSVPYTVPEGANAYYACSADVFSPVVPAEEGWYIVSFWVKADFGAGKKAPAGMPGGVFYISHYGADQARLGTDLEDYIWLPAWDTFTGQWKNVFQVIRQRPGATGIGFTMQMFPNPKVSYRFLVDAVQIRRLLPPLLDKPLSVNKITNNDYGCITVQDPDSTTGTAYKVVPGQVPAGAKISGGIRKSESPGLYEVVYRMKQEAPGKQGIYLWVAGGGGWTWYRINPSDFKENGKYQDFKILFFYPFSQQGSFYSWSWQGEGVYYFDNLTLKLLRPLSDRDAWDLLYDGVDPDKVMLP